MMKFKNKNEFTKREEEIKTIMTLSVSVEFVNNFGQKYDIPYILNRLIKRNDVSIKNVYICPPSLYSVRSWYVYLNQIKPHLSIYDFIYNHHKYAEIKKIIDEEEKQITIDKEILTW